MKVISIIGAGWLGHPLADSLATLGHKVYASRRTQRGAYEVNSSHVTGFITDLDQQDDRLHEMLQKQGAEVVIGAFPPGFRRGHGELYPLCWQYLCKQAKKAQAQRVIMVSSTSVYPEIAVEMTEDRASLLLSQTDAHFSDKSQIMLRAEQAVIDSGLSFAIVRCSGLFGANRSPARFVNSMKEISRSAPANMLHLLDAIGAVTFMTLHHENHIVNASTPNTTNKAEFYRVALERSEIEGEMPPITDTLGKHIISEKIRSLGYKFHYDHVLDAI